MRTRRAALSAITALVLVVVGSVGAVASSYGSSNPNLSNMPVLGLSYVKRGNVVGFWQSILYSDGHSHKCVSNSANGIDGYFGTRTKGGSTTWQNRFIGAGAGDGIVGRQTWTRAFAGTAYMGPDEYGNADAFVYLGVNANVYYVRNYSDSYLPWNVWGFESPSNPATAFQPFYWPDITFYTC